MFFKEEKDSAKKGGSKDVSKLDKADKAFGRLLHRLPKYKFLIRPIVIGWLWIMPILSLGRESIASFYVSTILSLLLSVIVWKYEDMNKWARQYLYKFFWPIKTPQKMYDLAVQIFIFSIFTGLAIFVFIGIALFAKMMFV